MENLFTRHTENSDLRVTAPVKQSHSLGFFPQGNVLQCSHSPSRIPELSAAEQTAFHFSVHTFHAEAQTNLNRSLNTGRRVNLVRRQCQVYL